MLNITCRFTQSAALVFKMDVSCITTQWIVYLPVDVPSSVSISGSKSVSYWLSWAYASWVKNSAQWGEVCQYTYPAGKLTIWEHWAPPLLPGGVGAVPGTDHIGAGVSYLCQLCPAASIPLHPLRVCGFCAVPFWQGRHPSGWFWQSIARGLSIATFTSLCSGYSTTFVFSSWTSAQGFLIRYCVTFIAECGNPPLAILAIFKARRMSDGSSCTRPPCLAIVADMMKPYKKLVVAVNNKIGLVHQPYTLP